MLCNFSYLCIQWKINRSNSLHFCAKLSFSLGGNNTGTATTTASFSVTLANAALINSLTIIGYWSLNVF